MKISSKLNELKPTDLNCNVFDVYTYDGLSMQELLCQFFTKINECIKVSNETIDLATWLVNEGLKIEVVKKLMLWLEDGTLENLINVNLFNTLHTKIENINSQLEHIENEKIQSCYAEDFGAKGDGVTDDTEALQNCFNYAYTNGKNVLLTASKTYCFTHLQIPPGLNLRGVNRSATLKHIGVDNIAITSGAMGNNANFILDNLTIVLNKSTTIGLNLEGFYGFSISNFSLCGSNPNGIGIKLGMGDDRTNAGYYNTFYNCYINGRDDNSYLGTGVMFVNSANSTCFTSCRFDYIETQVYISQDVNNDVFNSCYFEHFKTAIYTCGRATFASGCRFENTDTPFSDDVAVHIDGKGYYNSVIGCHFQACSYKVKDTSTNKMNVYFADTINSLYEVTATKIDTKFLRNIPHESWPSKTDEGLFFYYNGYLYSRTSSTALPIQYTRSSSTAGRPSSPLKGEMFFDTTLNKPIWWNGNAWKDATGSTV